MTDTIQNKTILKCQAGEVAIYIDSYMVGTAYEELPNPSMITYTLILDHAMEMSAWELKKVKEMVHGGIFAMRETTMKQELAESRILPTEHQAEAYRFMRAGDVLETIRGYTGS